MATKKEEMGGVPPEEALAVREESLATFGKIPAALAPLSGKYTFRERAGVVPSWLPEKVGDKLVGKIIDYRHNVGKFQTSLVVLETQDGARSVWLGADLSRKFVEEKLTVGAVVYIEYLGRKAEFRNMKEYAVYEIIPNAV